MGDNECLEEQDVMMAKGIVSMYRSVWVEVESQFPSFSVEERFKICSLIAPLINNMIFTAFNEDLIGELEKPSGKKKKGKR
jgi:hypothetical protein